MIRYAFSIQLFCALILLGCLVAPVYAQLAPATGDTLEALRAEAAQLRDTVSTEENSNRQLESQVSSTESRANRMNSLAFVLKNLLPSSTTGLGLLPSLGFFFATIALIVLILRFPASARKLLDSKYVKNMAALPVADSGLPVGKRAQLIWVIVLLIVIALLALPAFGQPPAVEPPGETVETEPSPTVPLEADSSLNKDIGDAIALIEMEPLERIIAYLENLPIGKPARIDFDDNMQETLQRRPDSHGHPPLAGLSDIASGSDSFLRESNEYYLILAALYESVARTESLLGALNSLATAPSIDPLPEDAYAAVAECLRLQNDNESLKAWISKSMSLSLSGRAIHSIGRVAIAARLQQETIAPVNQAILRLSSNRDEALPVVLLLYDLGAKTEAESLLQDFISTSNFEQAFEVLEWAIIGGVQNLIGIATDRVTSQADTTELLSLLSWAGEQNQRELALKTAIAAATKLESADHVNQIFPDVQKQSLAVEFASAMSRRIASNSVVGTWRVNLVLPPDHGVAGDDAEDVALSSLVGFWLLEDGKSQDLRELFEAPVRGPVRNIIDSLGNEQRIPLNDIVLLSKYYQIASDPGKDASDRMIVLQRQIRGLDQKTTADTGEEAARLALEMELESLRGQLARAKARSTELQGRRASAERELAAGRTSVLLHIANLAAKGFILLVGLRIALLRAIAAAKSASSFRFARFCWTFLETIGFELCTTIILLVPGVVLTLASQDRLKHFRITEQLVEVVASGDA